MGARIRRLFLCTPYFALLALSEPANACPPPDTEVCDGIDNDGDTLVDEDENPDAGEPPLCPKSRLCLVTEGAKAQCAAPSKYGGTFECPGGQTLSDRAMRSGTGEPVMGGYCFTFDACGGCFGEHCDAQGNPVCGVGVLPPCVCRSDGRCSTACAGVTCPVGYACHETEPMISTCQPNGDCRIAGGCAAGEVCFEGACFSDPCSTKVCAANQVCRGTKNGAFCETSCADVTCDQGTFCVRGGCYPRSGCTQIADANFCPPLTVCRPDGNCGDPPCAGVRCPAGQSCVDDECQRNVAAPDSAVPGPTLDASTSTPDGAPTVHTGVRLNGVGASDTSGCGCSVPSRASHAGSVTIAAVAVVLTRRFRRRRISLTKTVPRHD
jgi:hypothetical protein